MRRILIIDDEQKLSTLLTRIISLEGFEVKQAGDCKTGLKKLEQNDIDVVLCDVKLPDGNGVELVKEIKDRFRFTEVILLTAYGNIADGVQAIKNGAFDYITKGDDNNKITPLLYRALEKVDLSKRVQLLEKIDHRRPVIRMNCFRPSVASCLFQRQSGHSYPGFIYVHAKPKGIGAEDSDWRRRGEL